MKKLKIAQVITRMDWGGSPDIVRIICERLSSDYDMKLIVGITANPTEKTKKFLEQFRDNLIILPELKRNIRPFWDFLALVKLWWIFKKERFDLIHTHTAKAGFLGRLAAKLAGVKKVIYMPHGHIFYGYFKPMMTKFLVFLEKFAAIFTDKIITLTEMEKSDFLSFKIKNPSNIEVVPSGLEIDNFYKINEEVKDRKRRELKLNDRDQIVGMVSRLDVVKGPQYFIEASFKISQKKENIKFLIVGEGGLRPSLEEKVKELGLNDKVKFLGWREDGLEIISILDILVQPSLNEAVGRTLLEAQFLGVAVIATNVGGIPEIVKDNLGGVLVPPKDASSLAEATVKLLNNEEERLKMASFAKEWVKEKFEASHMVESISRIYKTL